TSAGTDDAGSVGAPARPGANRSRVTAVPSPCRPVRCSSTRDPSSRGVAAPRWGPRPSPGRLPWLGPGGGDAVSSAVAAIGLGPGEEGGGPDSGEGWLATLTPVPRDPPWAIRSAELSTGRRASPVACPSPSLRPRPRRSATASP